MRRRAQAAAARETAREAEASLMAPEDLPAWLREPTVIERVGVEGGAEDGEGAGEGLEALSAEVAAVVAEHKTLGFSALLPVQRAVLEAGSRGRDLMVCSPTGSGKTLAYVLPAVEALRGRVVQRLRVLVVVPTQELVSQVVAVFKPFCDAFGLTVIGTPTHGVSMRNERESLVRSAEETSADGSWHHAPSLADVVVATPGRLVAHLDSSPGFTLADLELLIVDEMDRVLAQHQFDWLQRVHDALNRRPEPTDFVAYLKKQPVPAEMRVTLIASRPAARSVQKLLFSATVTLNPQKIDSLRLESPHYVTTDARLGQHAKPASLEEQLMVIPTTEKVKLLLSLLDQNPRAKIIVFASTTVTTHRLALIIQLMLENRHKGDARFVVEYSAAHSARDRRMLSGKLASARVVVASDVLARGLDLNFDIVVSYDVPANVKSYVHRIGRTARAGRRGLSITVAVPEQVRNFRRDVLKSVEGRCAEVKVDERRMTAIDAEYQRTIQWLPQMLRDHPMPDGRATHQKGGRKRSRFTAPKA